MGLGEYWTNNGDGSDAKESVAELKEVLSQHYGKKVDWKEEEVDASKNDEEISVDVIDDRQLSALHAVAAKLELDGNLEGLDFDPEVPWDCEVFNRLAEVEDEDTDEDIEKFNHLLSIGNSRECFCLPVDLPFVAQINVGDEETEEVTEECHCHDGECDCECECEMDDGCVDISSLQALRREFDEMAKAMQIDTSLDIDDDVAMEGLDQDDYLYFARIGWYLFSKRIDEALAAKLPLIIRFTDDDEYEDDFDEVDE